MIMNKDGNTICLELGAGETSPPIFMNAEDEAVVVACPGVGGSITVTASWSLVEEIQAGRGDWLPWDLGTVTASASQSLYKATALKASAAVAAGTVDVRQ